MICSGTNINQNRTNHFISQRHDSVLSENRVIAYTY